jgi:hypothetical protein
MDVRVERFKNIQSVALSIDGILLLVGGNNSGKSSVLQAIQFGASVAQTSALQADWTANRLSTSIGQGDLVYSPIKDVFSLARNGRLREPEAEAISITYRDGVDECRVTVRRGRNKNILLKLVGRPLGARLQSIQNPYCALVTGLAGIPPEEEFETNIVVRKSAAKGDSNSVFRNILLQLRARPERWARFQEQIGRIFPGYVVHVSFEPDVDETISCTVAKGGVVYPIDTCGTGILQAIQIFSYINLFDPKLLLLDEPDSHLHPNNQKQLARELISVADSGLRIVVSTHSKHLVESLLDNATLCWLSNGVTQPPVDDYELRALMDIGALNVGDRLANPQYVFLTEDKNSSLFQVLLEANGYDLNECEVVSYAGCTQLATAVILISHLRQRFPNARYAIHRDRDFLSDEALNAYRARFVDMQVRVFFPSGNDLESHFSSVRHVELSCAVDEARAGEILFAAYNARREKLLEKLVNQKIENVRKEGLQVNAGQVAVDANAALQGPAGMSVHGKILLGGIRDELRHRDIPDRLMSVSDALICGELRDLWN